MTPTWRVSTWLAVVGLLLVWPVPPRVDPQTPGSISLPSERDSLRLVNILLRRPLGPRSVRQECRLLNSSQFDRITETINRAKRDTRIRPNVYDAFAYLHANPNINAGAHQGPGFLPFHRVLIFLFEKLLRLYDPTVSLCYWDSTLEPRDMTASPTWTSALFGNTQGVVNSGFAAGWLTPVGTLIRDGGRTGRPFRQEDMEQILQRDSLGEISFPGGNVESNLEEKHNYVHSYVGGLMGQVETASYDPIFWFHHSFVDCIYERFRQSQVQRGFNPMRDWPAEYGSPAHSPYAAMRLSSLRMIDGTNNFFSDRTLQCLDSVGSCTSSEDCGAHMRCDPLTSRCVSDTLAVAPQVLDDINSLESLLSESSVMSSIHRLLTSSARGFNQLFHLPSLESFDTLWDWSAPSADLHGISGHGTDSEDGGRTPFTGSASPTGSVFHNLATDTSSLIGSASSVVRSTGMISPAGNASSTKKSSTGSSSRKGEELASELTRNVSHSRSSSTPKVSPTERFSFTENGLSKGSTNTQTQGVLPTKTTLSPMKNSFSLTGHPLSNGRPSASWSSSVAGSSSLTGSSSKTWSSLTDSAFTTDSAFPVESAVPTRTASSRIVSSPESALLKQIAALAKSVSHTEITSPRESALPTESDSHRDTASPTGRTLHRNTGLIKENASLTGIASRTRNNSPTKIVSSLKKILSSIGRLSSSRNSHTGMALSPENSLPILGIPVAPSDDSSAESAELVGPLAIRFRNIPSSFTAGNRITGL